MHWNRVKFLASGGDRNTFPRTPTLEPCNFMEYTSPFSLYIRYVGRWFNIRGILNVTKLRLWRSGTKKVFSVISDVLTANVFMKNPVVLDMTTCPLINIHRRFGGPCCVHLQGHSSWTSQILKKDAAVCSDTLGALFKLAWHHILDYGNLFYM
jgi:hypothetical protein